MGGILNLLCNGRKGDGNDRYRPLQSEGGGSNKNVKLNYVTVERSFT